LGKKVNKKIVCFEDIINLDALKLKAILSKVSSSDIVKASMAASPMVNEILRNTFKEIDFVKERNAIGSVRITEVEEIHSRIVDIINNGLES